ncbi:hypothetical protein K1719_020460 [Acacia pycnantha]|nr:hypothetical protein K1719_020460 [Acacia pycnantha]
MPANSVPTQASSAGSSHPLKKGRGEYKYYKVDLRTRFGSKIPVKLSDDLTRATDVFTKKSKTNKSNRGKQVTKHTCGCLSFEEIKFATANLQDLRQQQEEVEVDARMTSDEILTAVLGERSGYVRGKEYGA